MMFFDKLDRLMSEIRDFADSIIDSTVLCLFLPEKTKPRLGFEPTTLGSDFCIVIFSVLVVTATRLLVYAIVIMLISIIF
jgi:hypothetical protein